MLNNSDKFDHLIALAAMKCAEEDAQELNSLDTSNVKFDVSYYRKKNRVIRKYKNMPRTRSSKVIAIRLVAAIVITIMLMAILIGCVPGLRQAIYDAIFGWHDEYFSLRYESPTGQEKETSPETEWVNEEIVAPSYIKETRKPTDLPEGVWEDIIVKSNAKVSIDYYYGEEYLFSFTQFVLDPSDKWVDNEEVDVTYTYINGNDATIAECTNKKEINILWSDGEYSYQIFSTECDVEALLKYAESVK